MLQGDLSWDDDVEQLQLGVTARLSHRSSNLSSGSFTGKSSTSAPKQKHDRTTSTASYMPGPNMSGER